MPPRTRRVQHPLVPGRAHTPASAQLGHAQYPGACLAHVVMAGRQLFAAAAADAAGTPEGAAMKFQFRITQELLNRIHQDLSRSHPVAQERVGFIVCMVGAASTTQIMIAESYVP